MGRGRCIRMKEWMTETRDTREGERRDGREVWWKEGAGGWEAMEWGIQDFFSGRKIERERVCELVKGKLGKNSESTPIQLQKFRNRLRIVPQPEFWIRLFGIGVVLSRPKSSVVIRRRPLPSGVFRCHPESSGVGVVGSESRLEI